MKMKVFHLKSTLAIMKLKTIDGYRLNQWSMLFNSIIHD